MARDAIIPQEPRSIGTGCSHSAFDSFGMSVPKLFTACQPACMGESMRMLPTRPMRRQEQRDVPRSRSIRIKCCYSSSIGAKTTCSSALLRVFHGLPVVDRPPLLFEGSTDVLHRYHLYDLLVKHQNPLGLGLTKVTHALCFFLCAFFPRSLRGNAREERRRKNRSTAVPSRSTRATSGLTAGQRRLTSFHASKPPCACQSIAPPESPASTIRTPETEDYCQSKASTYL